MAYGCTIEHLCNICNKYRNYNLIHTPYIQPRLADITVMTVSLLPYNFLL